MSLDLPLTDARFAQACLVGLGIAAPVGPIGLLTIRRTLAGGVRPAIERVKRAVGHLVKVEVEVDSLAQLEEALATGADAVLLDNMTLEQMAEAVKRVNGRMLTEASGGITLETVGPIAATGVDLISSGWLTHSAPALDLGLDYAD